LPGRWPPLVSSQRRTPITTPNRTKTDRLSLAKQLIAGTKKHFPNASQELTFGGATHTVAASTQQLQSYVDLRSAVLTSQAATKTQVATERAQTPSQVAFVAAYVAFVRATFGKEPDALADFGLAPPKAPKPLTAEQKAVATAKRKATRAARHTMGKNQKKPVKGAVTATLVVTPASGPVPVAPTPTPAATAPAPAPSGSQTGGSSTPHGS
jgi:hypothetical protein